MRLNQKKFAELRHSMGLTQAQLSERSGLSINQIKKYETGATENIGLKELEKYTYFFKIDLSELFIFEGDEKIFSELKGLKEKLTELESKNRQLENDTLRARSELSAFERAYKFSLDKLEGRGDNG